MKAEYIFNLYMMAPPRREPIDVTQNDNLMVELVAKLKNRNGTAFLPPEGAVANFIAVKPDGHGIVLRSDDPEDPKVTLADDEVRVSLPREALAVTGWIACKIAIQDNDAVASSQEFSLICNRDLLPEDFTESEAYQSIIYYLEHLGAREAEFDDMKEQFYQAINGLTEDDEVINARIDGPYATTFDTLKLRLDHMSGLLKGNTSEVENTKLKVIRLEQEVKRYKELYEQSNPTQSPRVTSTGYGVVSLPKNAGQGPMDVKVEGLTLKNELNYNRDTWEEWILTGGSSVSNGNLVVGIGTVGNTRLPSNFKPNTKYGVILTKVNSTLSELSISSASAFPTIHSVIPSTTLAGNFKLVITSKAEITNNSFNMFSSTSSEAPMEIKDIRMFELPAGSEIENDFETMTADQLAQKYPYVQGGGVRNTSGTFRVRSVNEDETISSEQYVVAPELRGLPNGVGDTIELGKHIKRVNVKTISGTDYNQLIKTYTNVDVVEVASSVFADASPWVSSVDGKVRIAGKKEVDVNDIDNEESVGQYYTNSRTLGLLVQKGLYNTIAEARTGLGEITVEYQLDTPIETSVQVSGSVQSYPNGTVYIEPAIADAGVYDGGFAILNTDYPIAELESVQKIDFQTGLSTELDVGQAVIAGGGLSFTHTGLSDGDIVFVKYKYDDSAYTAGKATCEYYDSRFVLKDDVTGKFYKEVKKVENGELVTQLVEV